MSISTNNLSNIDNLQVSASQVVLIYTEWNEPIITELRNGAKRILEQFKQITVKEIQVPGAVEIPFTIAAHYRNILLHHGNEERAAYIALGCVIKGDTPHFEYVCQAATQGITQLNTTIKAPTIMGILTVLNEAQAWERLGGAHGHKGEEAAAAALKMLATKEQLSMRL
jgi:6,7-dimethyl-8-ribityllumazine synthase